MNYSLSEHAKSVIAERAIREDWIERALSAPGRTVPDDADPLLIHHLRAVTEFGGRVLRVVVNPSVTPPRVVTAFFDRAMRGKL